MSDSSLGKQERTWFPLRPLPPSPHRYFKFSFQFYFCWQVSIFALLLRHSSDSSLGSGKAWRSTLPSSSLHWVRDQDADSFPEVTEGLTQPFPASALNREWFPEPQGPPSSGFWKPWLGEKREKLTNRWQVWIVGLSILGVPEEKGLSLPHPPCPHAHHDPASLKEFC